MAIGQKRRFAIFHRDNFTCQYCGRRPPDIVLQADHVIAKSKGGTDEDVNLITSCFDCNSGKSNKDLSQIPISVEESIKREREKVLQVKEFHKCQLAIIKDRDKIVSDLGSYWFDHFEQENEYVFGTARRPSIVLFLRKLPLSKIYEAMDITFSKKGLPRNKYDEEYTFRYFCGVVWKMIKQDEGAINA